MAKRVKEIEQFMFVFNPAELSAMAIMAADTDDINRMIMEGYAEEISVIRGQEWTAPKREKPVVYGCRNATRAERKALNAAQKAQDAAERAEAIRAQWAAWRPSCLTMERQADSSLILN